MNSTTRLLAPFGGLLLVGALAACVTPSEEVTPATPVTPAEPATPAEPPAKDIWTAAGDGDMEALAAHKAAGTDLDGLDMMLGVTPLMTAVVTSEHDAARWLLDNGADANAPMRDGGSALHGAAFVGNAAAAAMLLEGGADANAIDGNGSSVRDILAVDWPTTEYIASMVELYLVQEDVEAGRAEIGAMLEGAGNAGADGGEADIWAALATGDAAGVRGAIDAGADVNAVAPEGSPLLVVAASNGNTEVAAALLAAGADVNGANQTNGATALHAAAFLGHAEVAALLVKEGADVGALTDDGMNALQMTELDWPTTEYIAGMLQIAVEQEAVMAGRAKIAELLAQ